MELEKIRQLIELMKANDLSELKIVDGQTRIMLRRGPKGQVIPHVAAAPMVAPGGAGTESADQAPAPAESEPTDKTAPAGGNLLQIVAPMVGTFYAAPSPSAEPFVEVGAQVDTETVVCIIEAMKVMNEIKSEVAGTIRQVLVDNGQAVEFGQPLFLVEPL